MKFSRNLLLAKFGSERVKSIDHSTITESRAQSPERATSVPSYHGVFTGQFILRTILAQI